MPKVAEKRPQRSLCGVFDCVECEWHLSGRCAGCLGVNLTRRRRGDATCVIYDCVRTQKVESCWQCRKEECPIAQGARPFCVSQEGLELARVKLEERLGWVVRRREGGVPQGSRGAVSEPRLARARWYLAALDDMSRREILRVSSYDLARTTGVKSALVRRDLSCLGHLGTPSVGYEVNRLKDSISEFFGLGIPYYWVGAAKLAAEPSLIEEFASCNCKVGGIFDPSEAFIGKRVAGIRIRPLSELKGAVSEDKVCAAILALPLKEAQPALDTMVEAGIKGVLSLVSAPLSAPPHVVIQHADLPSQLFLLMARCRRH